MSDLQETLDEMKSEGLVIHGNGKLTLTKDGIRLSEEWKDLLVKREPILEFVAGLTDGSITGLVVILSVFLANLTGYLPRHVMFWTAFLSLAAVAITNFSSFMLGGTTGDIADALAFKALMEYSVSDIPDKEERRKSLRLVKHLFSILRSETTRTNLFAALVCSITTFFAGVVPIAAFLYLPEPINLVISFIIVGIVSFFLIRYRSEKSKVHWKTVLFETLLVIAVAVVASLVIGIW